MAYASPLKPFNRPFNKATYNVCGLCDKRSCYFVYDVQKTHDCPYCRRCYCVHDAQQTHDCAYCRRCFNNCHNEHFNQHPEYNNAWVFNIDTKTDKDAHTLYWLYAGQILNRESIKNIIDERMLLDPSLLNGFPIKRYTP